MIKEKLLCVNKPEYIEEKQNILDKIGLQNGETPARAKIEEFEYLRVMSEVELQVVLIALLPIIKLEEKPTPDKCKYMIGTQSGMLMIKTNQIMIRVGGGFATLEEHIRQVGPFECIKIYKLMKGNLDRKEEPRSFKEAVSFYLKRLKTIDKIVKQWLDTEDDQQMDLFENAIEFLKGKQEAAASKFMIDQRERRSSLRQPLNTSGSGGASAAGSKAGSPRGSPRGSIKIPMSPRGSLAGAKIGAGSPKLPASPRVGGTSTFAKTGLIS